MGGGAGGGGTHMSACGMPCRFAIYSNCGVFAKIVTCSSSMWAAAGRAKDCGVSVSFVSAFGMRYTLDMMQCEWLAKQKREWENGLHFGQPQKEDGRGGEKERERSDGLPQIIAHTY